MKFSCPVCRKSFTDEVDGCDRCGTDLSQLVSLKKKADGLRDAADEIDRFSYTSGSDVYREINDAWLESAAASEAMALPRGMGSGPFASIRHFATERPSRFTGVVGILVLLLVMGWGSTFAILRLNVKEANEAIAQAQHEASLLREDVLELKTELASSKSELELVEEQLVTSQEHAAKLSAALTSLEEMHARTTAVLDAYRANTFRDPSYLAKNPERFAALLSEVSPADQMVVNRARKWGAIELFNDGDSGNILGREEQLQASIQLWSTGYHVDDAYFSLAKIHEAENPKLAIEEYQKVLGITHGWWYHDEAMYGIGKVRLSLGERQDAIEVFKQVRRDYGGTEGDRLSGIALRKLGESD